jgi:hypothetical protein
MHPISDMIDQVQVLRLHTADDGLVWFGDDASLGTNSYLEVADFFACAKLDAALRNTKGIRLLGTANNAALILQLSRMRMGRSQLTKKVPVVLGSPVVCLKEANLREPEAVLRYLWQPESKLAWQWHRLGETDYCSYGLIDALQESKSELNDKVQKIAAYHYAWPAVTFVPNFDALAACQFLASIVDPRWYVHFTHPHRMSRLLAYLGLTPQNVAAFLGFEAPAHNYERALPAIRAWYNETSVAAYNSRQSDSPNDFLWRIFASQENVVKGVLRGTQRLVSLVYQIWLYSISPANCDVAFQPDRFFKDERESQAFQAHHNKVLKT